MEGKTAHEVVKKVIAQVMVHGDKKEVWGGTIPQKIGDPNSPTDFDRTMLEHEPMVFTLTNPLARWCDISDHWVGITLRETEDTLQGYNPGHIIKYSKLYPVWIEKDGKFNYTYGERFLNYGTIPFNQFQTCIGLLRKHPTTRKACINTWAPNWDLFSNYVPCNVFFQLRIVDEKLQWTTVVRSLDVLRGLTENLFMFTIWQEYASSLLKVPVGEYITCAINPHLYMDQIEKKQHLITVKDCYEFYNPKPAFETPFPAKEFARIDHYVFDKKRITDAVEIVDKLPTYWKNWKLSLLAEWERINHKYTVAENLSKRVTNEFGIGIRERLKKSREK